MVTVSVKLEARLLVTKLNSLYSVTCGIMLPVLGEHGKAKINSRLICLRIALKRFPGKTFMDSSEWDSNKFLSPIGNWKGMLEGQYSGN